MNQELKLDSKIIIDKIEYTLKDKIKLDRKTYYLFQNDKKEYMIRKTIKLQLLNDEKEFDKIYNIFRQRNAF